jgi:hypothetical protein
MALTCPAAAYILLDIDLTDSQDPVMAFTSYSYTISYMYNTPGGGDATIIDQLPPEVSFESATGGGIYDSATHSVRWDVGQTFRSTVLVTVIPDRIPFPVCDIQQPQSVIIQNTATISKLTESRIDTEPTTIIVPVPVCSPEFPSTILPVTMIIGFLGAVLYIQRTREH